jgi:hypothetical protein
MSRAEEIIVKHIKELESRRDAELEFQVWAEDNDYVYDQKESDDRWREYTDRRFELLTVLAEIRDCDLDDLVLE